MIRVIDFLLALIGLCLLWPVLLIICLIGYFDTGSPVFFQQRVGKNRHLFTLIKFRTMPVDTQSVATHLVGKSSVTPLGGFLRKTKLDELPQLINVVKGDMSLVGPRPCLANQQDVIEAREIRNVFTARPGITGLAQIEDVDMSTPTRLAELDAKMLESLTVSLYFSYIVKTVLGAGTGDRV
ncbi:sugar transferase [Vibrio palustris]|uniref:Undecaprenyl phosphate N,N'-diacetylbacillosamine 1-phosphate transferase n=1 Tax=Vibrio palustris TaxID=1918946 RepID=A0A1R4B3N0_9VIBR|nr:sugar transferase [Vibrio palustris]SJL83528.1 Undecaprenyl phosphate N,N'-diacetylbacillosamine 1-phosphate transferase [Vibrio palustris]